MASRGPYLDGCKVIAAHTGRSERWVRYMMRRDPRPLPVCKVAGMFRMYLHDYEAWLSQEMTDPVPDSRRRIDAWPRRLSRESDPDALGW